MKRLFFIVIGLVTFGLTSWSQNKNFIDQPYIVVRGSADSLIAPDEIYINILLSEKDSRDRIPLEELETRMIADLKSLGIDVEKDLSVGDILSNYQKYLFKSKDILKSKVYNLKVTSAGLASRVYVKLEESGISNLSIERVAHSRMAELQLLVKSKAILNAKARALAFVNPLGQNIGPAIQINDVETAESISGATPSIKIRGFNSKSDNADVSRIEFEKIKISMGVTATFILR